MDIDYKKAWDAMVTSSVKQRAMIYSDTELEMMAKEDALRHIREEGQTVMPGLLHDDWYIT